MTHEDMLAVTAIGALVIYSVTGGADFGGGVWDLLAVGPRARAQREVIARAVAPIWEANHVWLIFVIVILFVCFPAAYAVVGTALHVPLTLMLVGIVLRGAAFAFRSHDYGPAQRRWDLVFACASVVTPLMLGTCVGAVSSGAIDAHLDGTIGTDFVSSWLAPFPLTVGALTVVEFSFLAATYLTLEAQHDVLRGDFRIRALGSGVGTAVLGWAALALARTGAPVVYEGLTGNPAILALTGLAAVASLGACWIRQYTWARGLAIVHVATIVIGWAMAQYPYLVVPGQTVANAHASDVVVQHVLLALEVGTALLIPAFVWLYRVFKGAMND